jgi:hypothetical protein
MKRAIQLSASICEEKSVAATVLSEGIDWQPTAIYSGPPNPLGRISKHTADVSFRCFLDRHDGGRRWSFIGVAKRAALITSG